MRSFWRERSARARRLTFVGCRFAVASTLALGASGVTLGCAPAGERGFEPSRVSRSAASTAERGSASSALAMVGASAVGTPPQEPSRGTLRVDPVEVRRLEHPLADLDAKALKALATTNVTALGSASVGRPNRGNLLNAVQMPEGKLWKIAEPKYAWGTAEAIESVQRAIERVESDHPGSPLLYVGHISRKQGGWLRPHRSHQSGRDVDLGYYYLDGPRWYVPAREDNLDRPRTWALLLGLVSQGNVEYVFVSRSVQALLLEHARSQGVDEAWLDTLFSEAAHAPSALVRHSWGHHTHLHVRFYSDAACETGERTRALFRPTRRR
jgi:penicillin-insensitive murein endopeptidase